ncbi:MAG: hypothetical protein SPK49_07655 [Erysipelotrichaceae bacterium]|nr:hypothetical protein [Erysipelotrichaceae bacterium]
MAKNKSANEIILNLEYENLKNELLKKRTELSMLVLQRDELKYVICKNIETEYMLELGSLEYCLYQSECIIMRLKRKVELIQMRINRQEKIDVPAIDKLLDEQFREYQQKLEEKIKKMNEAIERGNGEVLTEQQAKELKKLYRAIVKALHPDLNPNVTKQQIKLFQNAVTAYKNGDLQTLRIINEMISNNHSEDDNTDNIEKMRDELIRLDRMISSINGDVEKIKAEYPYTMKNILFDKEQLNQRKEELKDNIDQCNELVSFYKTKIQNLLGDKPWVN